MHAFEHDGLGRETQDRRTTLGDGVDGGARRIATTYEVRGMRAKITSYDNAAVGSGSVVNQTQFSYCHWAPIGTKAIHSANRSGASGRDWRRR